MDTTWSQCHDPLLNPHKASMLLGVARLMADAMGARDLIFPDLPADALSATLRELIS